MPQQLNQPPYDGALVAVRDLDALPAGWSTLRSEDLFDQRGAPGAAPPSDLTFGKLRITCTAGGPLHLQLREAGGADATDHYLKVLAGETMELGVRGTAVTVISIHKADAADTGQIVAHLDGQ